MKKVLWLIVCLMTMVASANAHNVHYPTYTEDGITYVANYRDKQGNFSDWDVLKVDKPYDKTIIIPNKIVIDGKEETLNRIKGGAFSTCISLDSLIISDGLYVEEEGFKGCKELEYLYYSSNSGRWSTKNKYSYYPDLSCKTLETSVGVAEDAFWKSVEKTLEKLIIKEDSKFILTRIDGCKKLKTIICHAINPPKTGPVSSPYGYGSGCGHEKFASYQWSIITLYVPRESLEDYYFHNVWGEIDNIYAIDEMVETPTFINSTIANGVIMDDVWYSLDGTKVDEPTKGVYIKNGKKYVVK